MKTVAQVLVLWLASIACGAAWGQPEDDGEFLVRTASHELEDGVYYVDSLIYLRLPTDARDALNSGLGLSISIQVELLNRLRLWWDAVEHDITIKFQLTYSRLTNRYLVHNIRTDDSRVFETLPAALEYLGRVDHLPLIDESVLDEDRRYDIRVRAVLDKDALPGALRLLAFWRRDWSIASDWLTWRLDDE